MPTAGGATPKQGSGSALDLRSLLQSLGLGEEVLQGLTEVGLGPLGPAGGQDGDADQQQQQGYASSAGGLDPSASWSSRWVGSW